jgi:CRISPR/Cas system-associated exonuclease Cas4 (RecB family)
MTGPSPWSYSSLSAYLHQCTLKYFFRYVARLDPERTFSRMHFGLAVHAGLEAVYKAWKAGDPAPLDVAKKTFEADLLIRVQDPLLEFRKNETPEGLLIEGTALLETWAREARYEEVIGTETPFTVPLVHPKTGEAIDGGIAGWFDLVVKDPETGAPVVVDFKTTSKRLSPSNLDADLQLCAYGYAIRHLHGLEEAKLRLDVLVRNKKPVFQRLEVSIGPEGDARLFELVRAAERGVQAGVFFPNEGSLWCSGCPYGNACSRWHDDPASFRRSSDDRRSRRRP